jgi:hypothetical protein
MERAMARATRAMEMATKRAMAMATTLAMATGTRVASELLRQQWQWGWGRCKGCGCLRYDRREGDNGGNGPWFVCVFLCAWRYHKNKEESKIVNVP